MSFVGVYFIVGGRGSVEVVVQAAKVEPTPVTVTTNIFPCKLSLCIQSTLDLSRSKFSPNY